MFERGAYACGSALRTDGEQPPQRLTRLCELHDMDKNNATSEFAFAKDFS